MRILVLNAGSSSLKFHLFDGEALLTRGEIERVSNMADALAAAFQQLGDTPVDAVGHRIVHGGERLFEATLLTEVVVREIEAVSALAPLHNPVNLAAYRAARARLPGVPHVAVFDTAFHHTLPPHAFVYGLPYEFLSQRHIRRYGFHGISHRYVSTRYAELQGKAPADLRLITCHLGNGCSVSAIERGRSVDTSMGFTPLEGLIMGTRTGDIDAGAILHLISQEKLDPVALAAILNHESGLKGISGISSDMRDLLRAADNPRAALAIDAFCYRVRKYIGAYLAAMNGADALVFTAGIGENSAAIRARICDGLDQLGIAVDSAANQSPRRDDRQIGFSRIPVWVVPTNEELLIARDTRSCILKS